MTFVFEEHMEGIRQIAEADDGYLILPLGNISCIASDTAQERIREVLVREGLERQFDDKHYGVSDREYVSIFRPLSHAEAIGVFGIIPGTDRGVLRVDEVSVHSDLLRGVLPKIMHFGIEYHVISDINNLDTDIGKVTFYTRDKEGSNWSLHCGNWPRDI